VFFMDIKDFQLNTFTGTGFVVGNPGGVESVGVEVESTWVASPYLTLTAGVTYADAEYDDDVEGDSTHPSGTIAGRNLTHAPEWQSSAAAYVEVPVDDAWNVFGNLNWAWRDEHNTGSDLDVEKIVDDYHLWNAQLGVRTPDQRWEAYLWCTNCFDQDYRLLIFDSVLQGGSYHAFFGEPRIWGATLRTNF